MPLSAKLLEAYRNAEYVVSAEPELVFRIDEPSPGLDELMASYEADTAAFITAANPRGERKTDEENKFASEQLHLAAAFSGYNLEPGEGRDPQKRWPAEPSWLILGISREDARAVGEQFEQNAIVFCEKGRPPELVVLAD